MKKILAVLLCSWCGLASAQTAEELLNDGKNPENITTFGMGYDLKMYSPLKEINKSNVRRLVPIWNFSLSNDIGEHSQPTIYNGVMYVVNGNWTFAIDVATGRQIWRTPVQYERGALRVATSGALMRGPATIYQGRLFRQTVDAHVLALDMKTGKEIWKQKYAEWKEGYKGVIAPMIANGVLVSGMGGGDSTTRGFVEGYDPDTGKRLWRRWTIPAPGEPGSETWPNQTKPDAWKYGGGATWQSASYDPQLDLLYIGTGNAEPYNPTFRDGADCLYTASILALRPKTGEMVWYYQTVPNDSFDFDATAESLLADIRVDGQPRKVLINAHKNGFLYVLDRTNGKLIAANPYVKVNWATHIDLKTGRPVLTDLLARAMKGETVNVFPSRGTNATLIAFNPKNGPGLRQLVEFPAADEVRGLQVRAWDGFHRHRVDHGDTAGGAARLSHGDRAADRQSGVAGADDGIREFGGHARDRRRPPLHRAPDGRIHRARPGQRQDAVEVQDRFIGQRAAHHVHAQGPAVRHRALRARRQRRQPAGDRQRARRRLGVDLRPDARLAGEGR